MCFVLNLDIASSLKSSLISYTIHSVTGFPGGTSGKELICQCRRHNRQGVWSLRWEDPLQEEMATHSSILAWEIPWTEEPGRLQFMRSESRTRLSTHAHTHTHSVITWGPLWGLYFTLCHYPDERVESNLFLSVSPAGLFIPCTFLRFQFP